MKNKKEITARKAELINAGGFNPELFCDRCGSYGFEECANDCPYTLAALAGQKECKKRCTRCGYSETVFMY